MCDEGTRPWRRVGRLLPISERRSAGLMVPGTAWSSWTWRRIAPRLAERFTVYVYDLLGSASPISGWGKMSRFRRMELALLTCWSTGGWSAQRSSRMTSVAQLRCGRICCITGRFGHWR